MYVPILRDRVKLLMGKTNWDYSKALILSQKFFQMFVVYWVSLRTEGSECLYKLGILYI